MSNNSKEMIILQVNCSKDAELSVTDHDLFDPTLSQVDRTRFFAVVLYLNFVLGSLLNRRSGLIRSTGYY